MLFSTQYIAAQHSASTLINIIQKRYKCALLTSIEGNAWCRIKELFFFCDFNLAQQQQTERDSDPHRPSAFSEGLSRQRALFIKTGAAVKLQKKRYYVIR